VRSLDLQSDSRSWGSLGLVERHESDLKAAADAQMSAASVPVLRADRPRQASDDRGGYARHENGVEHDHVALLWACCG
jgi:hypothetical protein